MIIETVVGVAACGALGEWIVSRGDRVQLRRIRGELPDGAPPPALVFPVLFPSAQAAVASAPAVRQLGFVFRLEAESEDVPGAGRWAEVEVRLSLSWLVLRYARWKVWWVVRRHHGSVFDFEWRTEPGAHHDVEDTQHAVARPRVAPARLGVSTPAASDGNGPRPPLGSGDTPRARAASDRG